MSFSRSGDVPNSRTVTIDAFPESAFRHLGREAIVCIDVIRTTTTLVSSRPRCRNADSGKASMVTVRAFGASPEREKLIAKTIRS